MKKIIGLIAITALIAAGCNNNKENQTNESTGTETTTSAGGQEAVQDDESAKDVVKIAVGSKDHTTLVAALETSRTGNIAFQCRSFHCVCTN